MAKAYVKGAPKWGGGRPYVNVGAGGLQQMMINASYMGYVKQLRDQGIEEIPSLEQYQTAYQQWAEEQAKLNPQFNYGWTSGRRHAPTPTQNYFTWPGRNSEDFYNQMNNLLGISGQVGLQQMPTWGGGSGLVNQRY